MRSAPFLLASTLVLVFFAGCLGDGTTSSKGAANEKVVLGHKHSAQESMMEIAPDFKLEMNDCIEGGGVSLYNMKNGQSGPVAPFHLESISDDTGYPKVASYGNPIPDGGATYGIWHTSVICQSYSYKGVPGTGPLKWGWVGMRIQPPEWDTDGITREYFVADFSVSDENIVQDLNLGNIHASRNLNTKIEWIVPEVNGNGVLHTTLDDEDHGVFETHAKMKEWKEMPLGAWRFWMLVSTDGMHAHNEGGPDAPATYKAISFDINNSAVAGKKATHQVVDGTGWLSHTRTDAHGATPGAAGNVGGLLFQNFDRTITMGPSPGIVFDKTWEH